MLQRVLSACARKQLEQQQEYAFLRSQWDEVFFSSRKRSRNGQGRNLRGGNGLWFLDGVEVDRVRAPDEKRVRQRHYIVPVHDRCRETLLQHIRPHCDGPRSTVTTDEFAAYGSPEGVCAFARHQTVKHATQWVDPDSGANTQTIEAVHSSVKRFIRGRGSWGAGRIGLIVAVLSASYILGLGTRVADRFVGIVAAMRE
jgi:hypothetical protein